MTLKTYTIEKKDESRKQVWEWEETPELLAAIEQLQKSSQAVKEVGIFSVADALKFSKFVKYHYSQYRA